MFQAYLITCTVSGRQYVGITSRALEKRWVEHLYSAKARAHTGAICRAILKHGPQAFSIKTICCFRTWEDACSVEDILIAQFGTIAPNGYNLMGGGKGRAVGFKPSAESIERSAAKHRGRPCHANTKLAASEYHSGRPKSKETRAKIAEARRGVPRPEGMKAKLSAYWAARRAAGDFKTTEAYAHGSKSSARKAASAQIAKIPLALSRHIARAWLP